MASSIKCPKVYRALREKRGMSQAKAAAISNDMARKGRCGQRAVARSAGQHRG